MSLNLTGPVLISGASGMLGTDLTEFFISQLGEENVIPFSHGQFDITRPSEMESVLKELGPSVILNAAAYTNVDGAEKDRDLAYSLNVEGPKNLARLGESYGITVVHFSSDYVFNGVNDRPWREDDATAPVTPGWYAQTKLEGEEAILEYANSLVLRVQWLYGKKRDRFTPLKEKKSFTPLVDQVGAPTWTWEIAEVVYKLLEKKARGLFHFSYDDAASWFEVFEFVKKTWNLEIELVPKKSSELMLPARRPLYCVLSNEKLCRTLGLSGLGSWKDPLKRFLTSV